MLKTIRGRWQRLFRSKASGGQVLTDSEVGWTPYLHALGIGRDNIPSDPRELVNQYRSWVYVCSTTNARFMSALSLRLYVRKPKGKARTRFLRHVVPVAKAKLEYMRTQPHLRAYTGDPTDDVLEVMEHPFLTLLTSGDGEHTGLENMQLTDIYQELTGDGYWYLEAPKNGPPSRYVVLPSHYTRIIAPKGKLLAYRVGSEPDHIDFEPDEVIHFRFPSPFNLLQGYGPGHAAYGESHFDEVQLNLEKAMQDNHNIPPALLAPQLPQALTKTQMDQFREEWKKHYTGVRNAGKIGLAPFPVRLLQFALDPRKVEMLQRRRASKAEIAAVFGLSPTMLDLSKSDASAVQGDITYQRNTILPRAKLKEARLNAELISRYGDPYLFCAHDNPVPADREYELRRAQAMAQTSDLFYVNEIRRGFGAEPDPTRENERFVHEAVGSFAGTPNGAVR